MTCKTGPGNGREGKREGRTCDDSTSREPPRVSEVGRVGVEGWERSREGGVTRGHGSTDDWHPRRSVRFRVEEESSGEP